MHKKLCQYNVYHFRSTEHNNQLVKMVQRVAVIGAGAAGICALRHLTARPNMFEAVGFEQLGQVGGTWIYTDKSGLDEYGLPIQSSMYKNLK